MQIGNREVGGGFPMMLVAELSANHSGSLKRARQLVKHAASAGADAIKLQTFRPKELAVLRGGGQAPPPWEAYTLEALYEEAQTPWEWHAELFGLARELGMLAFSSTFSAESTAFLLDLGVPCLKVSAFEWGHFHEFGIPLGVSLICSVRSPIEVPPGGGGENVAFLYCPPGYPPNCSNMNLRRIIGLPKESVVGLSDHSLCIYTPLMARALGASILEVHLMLDEGEYDTPPLDAAFSWRPEPFMQLVRSIRHAELTL